MAAGAALRAGHTVTLLEHTDKPGQKILVTGKGRCNVTNNCTEEEYLRHVRANPRFLYSALAAFPPSERARLRAAVGVRPPPATADLRRAAFVREMRLRREALRRRGEEK